jgi:hypothetical protein
MFELGFDKQAAEKLDFSFLYEDDDEEYLIGIDERSYALLTIILFCKKRNYGIVVGSIKLLRQEDAKWSDQFRSILIPILKLLKHKLVPFILMDGLKSHLKFMLKNLKFDNKHLTLSWLPDMFHLFAHLANFLAGNSVITVQLLGKNVKLKFNGTYFDNNETWNLQRQSRH